MAGAFDWEAVERDYRLGRWSLRELAAKHGPSEGMIRKKAKAGGWEKDLSAQIRARVQQKVTQTERRERADVDIVEEASEVVAEIVRVHQRIIAKTRDQLERLQLRIDTLLDDENAAPEQIARTLGATTQSIERTIKLERMAVGLDDDTKNSTAGRTIAELLKEVGEE